MRSIIGFMAVLMGYAPQAFAGEQTMLKQDSARVQEELNSTIQLAKGTLKFGGYVKLDIIQDFNPIGETDQFDISTIPTDGSTGTNFRMHARQSRFNLDYRGPVYGKEMRIFAEVDFWGSNNGYAPRLRHVYGSWGPLLAGQTWSTFVDEKVMPNTIDFESPQSFPNLRLPMVRLTMHAGKELSVSVAIEEPIHKIVLPDTISGAEHKVIPTFVGRLVYTKPNSHVQVGGMYGLTEFDPDAGPVQDANLWGVSASGKVKITGKDAFMASVSFGDGVSIYRSGSVTAVFNDEGNLDIPGSLGAMAAYEHYWVDHISSTFSYGYVREFYDEYVVSQTLNKSGHYASANLLWWFLGKYGYGGIEYLYGNREITSGADGTAHRLQVAFKFILP